MVNRVSTELKVYWKEDLVVLGLITLFSFPKLLNHLFEDILSKTIYQHYRCQFVKGRSCKENKREHIHFIF